MGIKILDKRLAVKHGNVYEVYEYTGNNNRKETIKRFDRNFVQGRQAFHFQIKSCQLVQYY